jgi:hypothetical protein
VYYIRTGTSKRGQRQAGVTEYGRTGINKNKDRDKQK